MRTAILSLALAAVAASDASAQNPLFDDPPPPVELAPDPDPSDPRVPLEEELDRLMAVGVEDVRELLGETPFSPKTLLRLGP